MRSILRAAWIRSCGRAQLAHGYMLAAVRRNAPSAEAVNDVMMGRHARRPSRHRTPSNLPWSWPAARASTARMVWSADSATSRRARYHPLQTGPQAEYAGAMALGLPVERIF